MRESWRATMGSVRVRGGKEEDSAELESRERLMSSPRPGESHEGVLESHNGLSPSQEARSETQ